jgi:hypothetical protein
MSNHNHFLKFQIGSTEIEVSLQHPDNVYKYKATASDGVQYISNSIDKAIEFFEEKYAENM